MREWMIRPFTIVKELTNGNFCVEFLDRQVVTSHLNSLNRCLTELLNRILLFVLLLFFFNVMIALRVKIVIWHVHVGYYSQSCCCYWMFIQTWMVGVMQNTTLDNFAIPMSTDHIYYCMIVEVYFLYLGWRIEVCW